MKMPHTCPVPGGEASSSHSLPHTVGHSELGASHTLTPLCKGLRLSPPHPHSHFPPGQVGRGQQRGQQFWHTGKLRGAKGFRPWSRRSRLVEGRAFGEREQHEQRPRTGCLWASMEWPGWRKGPSGSIQYLQRLGGWRRAQPDHAAGRGRADEDVRGGARGGCF